MTTTSCHHIALKLLTLSAAACLAVGCGDSVDPALLQARDQFETQQPASETMVVSKIRGRIEREEVQPPVDVVVRGRIHAGEMPPWETGKAAFILTDISGHEGESDHDPHTCPFCSKNINDYLARVSFTDESGVLPFDSRDLFDVQEKQIVVIRGEAQIEDDNMLAIDADSIYIERK